MSQNEEELDRCSDMGNEALFVGALYKNPALYLNYESLIVSKYDFDDPDIRFLYDTFEMFYKTFSQEVNKGKLAMFMSKNAEREEQYSRLGGWSIVSKLIDMTDVNDIESFYKILKKYSIVRELSRKGFPTEKILNHKKFERMGATDIIASMEYNLANINTVIGGGKKAVILGNDARDKVAGWRETPDMGEDFPFALWNVLFRGWRAKKLIIDGMLSNEGKSRKVARIAAYMSVLNNNKSLILANEMDEEEFFAMCLSTICNSPEFGFNLNIPERNILLGEYKDEAEYDRVMEVSKWFEDNSNIHFLEMNHYSNDDLKREIKKYTLLGVRFVFYDTMKGFQTDAWDSLKQTATLLKDIANEFRVAVYASIQLTDDSLNYKIEEFSSNNIANSKQIKHVADHMFLGRRIQKQLYDKYEIETDEWGTIGLDPKNTYVGMMVEKNRGGEKNVITAYTVDLDLNTWIEVGVLKVKRK